ncbi:serine/threonine-protein kinase/endoribonuclease IRE1a isoform X2 [Morus notabilis]|uniref:serine/threonine-protein kinase/endoribonuclease IRE1a isoform X2 n=1 Tax=Morus notabilis TaxID=981085 RepID=UPI000CED0CF7|nr:serine/threonine-protein kinase/endoribonuclease IRE1a isoform X2 [Morus notabilis]
MNIVKAAEDAIRTLKENPTPRMIEIWKNILRDLHNFEEECTTSSSKFSFDEKQLRIGKKLVVSLSAKIGQGSYGTVLHWGSYEDKVVIVKRLPQSHFKLIDKEIEKLIASNQDQNIVRYHGVERDKDFIYLAQERCDCNLDDLIQIHSSGSSQFELVSNDIYCSTSTVTLYKEDRLERLRNILGDVKLCKENNGRPSSLLLKLMRDIVSGLVHLHDLGVIHGDLKPQNILITKQKSTLCAKLSDMGINKCLLENMTSSGCNATGWKAPEQLLYGRQTSAMDLFSLGCVLFFCITGGRHPFGDHDERDRNIKRNRKQDLFLIQDFPEAFHLISHLLEPDHKKRPKAIEVLNHPLFWDAEKRLSFLHDTSDRVGENSYLLKALERTAHTALGTKLKGKVVLTWDNMVDDKIIRHMSSYLERNYKFSSVRDLLRLIRNMLTHYGQLDQDIQILIGSLYDGFEDYFTSRFPMLLMEVYKVVCTYYGEEKYCRKYFMGIYSGEMDTRF